MMSCEWQSCLRACPTHLAEVDGESLEAHARALHWEVIASVVRLQGHLHSNTTQHSAARRGKALHSATRHE